MEGAQEEGPSLGEPADFTGTTAAVSVEDLPAQWWPSTSTTLTSSRQPADGTQ
ncbi:hypothetical protein [Streptomyces sp. NPDC059165]|uniref:hypothetical protein n=1 Tax=Streptomyces sp. NPDC059165 TaxID=3346751 RepID=UPI00369FB5BB